MSATAFFFTVSLLFGVFGASRAFEFLMLDNMGPRQFSEVIFAFAVASFSFVGGIYFLMEFIWQHKDRYEDKKFESLSNGNKASSKY